MRNSTRIVGATFSAAALALGMAPAASANHWDNNNRGNLLVCVSDLNGREADIEINGPSDRDDETRRCAWFGDVRRGWYKVELDAPWRCDDDTEWAKVRSGRTTKVFFDADCPSWNGGGGNWQNDDNDDDDDNDRWDGQRDGRGGDRDGR